MSTFDIRHRSPLLKILLWFSSLWTVWGFVACTSEREFNGPIDARGTMGIEVELSIPMFGSLNSSNGLKAFENNDLEKEAQVRELYLFFRPSDTPDAALQKVTFDYSSAPLTSGLLSERIVVETAGQYDFFAVANPTAALKTRLNAVTTSADLQNIVVDAGDDYVALQSPFVMYGEAKDMTVGNQVKIGIRLNRLVACIQVLNSTETIDGSIQDVTVSSIQLFNGNKTSFLTPHFSTADNTYATPSPATKYDGTEIEVDGFIPSIYTFEAFNTDHLTDDADEDPANDKALYLVVHLHKNYYDRNGELQSEDYGYYRINAADFRSQELVCRNGLYFISIKNVYGKGYSTVAEARKNRASNLVLEYAKDADDFIFAGEDRYKYVLMDGEYYLALATNTLRLPREPWLEEDDSEEYPIYINRFWIKTNAPSGRWNFSIDIDTSNAPANWFRAEELRFGGGQPEGLLLYKDELLTIGGEVPSWDFIRYATLTISVEGRPNLTVRIPVSQEMDDGYYNDIDADPSLHVTSGREKEVFSSVVATTWDDTSWFVYRVFDSEGNEDPDWLDVTVGSPVAGQYDYPDISNNVKTYDYYRGKSSITIIADKLEKGTFYKEGYIELKMIPFAGYLSPKSTTIRVISGLALDYKIRYPDNEPKKRFMEREKRVIESSLYQYEPQTYTVSVNSTMSWHVEASDPSWITVTQPEFASGSYNDHFTVTIPVNDVEVIDGLPKAREGYVNIIGDQFYKRIMVYQGGYVEIDGNIWMDRNLQITNFYGTTRDGRRYNQKIYDSNQKVKVRDLLYAGAVPIAHPGNEPIIYAYGRHWGEVSSDWSYRGMTARIPSEFGNSKNDYLTRLMDCVYINSRDNTGAGTNYTFNKPMAEVNDGYFTFGMYGTFPCVQVDRNMLRKLAAWNGSYRKGTTANVMDLPVSKGRFDPCPDGWRVPSHAEFFSLTSHLKKAHKYSSGIENFVPVNYDSHAAKGEINNGLYFYNRDNVSCWFPFAGYRIVRFNYQASSYSMKKLGVETSYWDNFSDDGMNAFRYTIGSNNWFFENWMADEGQPVRCVRDIDK